MARQVFVLDLSDEALAGEYERAHQPGGVPQQVLADIRATGVSQMEIFRFADRLVMVTETDGNIAPGDRLSSQASVEWEQRMDRFQRPVPGGDAAAKWQPAKLIFNLSEHLNKEI